MLREKAACLETIEALNGQIQKMEKQDEKKNSFMIGLLCVAVGLLCVVMGLLLL